ncbi:MAG TPA: CheR family methyltransferase [Cyclobacteriaceae bacterium]|nr:CheR family methyltransferase [Cyclobacteriaceae bacterium]
MAAAQQKSDLGLPAMTIPEFNRLAALIYEQSGIRITLPKKIMLESRLSKRLRTLAISSYSGYLDFIQSREGQEEIIPMIDAVSTNKTDFFREPHHYEVLVRLCLPFLQQQNAAKEKWTLNVWSAACSTGEEPYTLAIVLSESSLQPGVDFSILASDISTHVLEKAIAAVYPRDRVDHMPQTILKKYFLKSKDQKHPTVKPVAGIRKKVQFCRVNFMDTVLDVSTVMDIIFCRNVLIYFDRKTQEDVIVKLLGKLKVGGFLFIGHSESLHGMPLPLKLVHPTVYQKTA